MKLRDIALEWPAEQQAGVRERQSWWSKYCLTHKRGSATANKNHYHECSAIHGNLGSCVQLNDCQLRLQKRVPRAVRVCAECFVLCTHTPPLSLNLPLLPRALQSAREMQQRVHSVGPIYEGLDQQALSSLPKNIAERTTQNWIAAASPTHQST
jgi:hypothetical protein